MGNRKILTNLIKRWIISIDKYNLKENFQLDIMDPEEKKNSLKWLSNRL